MRKLIIKTAGWIHAVLILALIIPLLYALGAERSGTIGRFLYPKCLIILIPVVFTDLAADKCKGMFSYLIVCALTFTATGALGWAAAGSLHQSVLLWGYIGLLLCETVFVIIERLAERLHKEKKTEDSSDYDPRWRPVYNTLREPSFTVLIYFGVIYTAALNLDNPSVCNAALFSAVLYVPVTVLYRYVCETENYLSLNKRTCNLPSKRIYGIGGGMLAVFLLLFLFAILPSLLTVSGRRYHDIRKWGADIEIDYTELFPENHPEDTGEDPMGALIAEYGSPGPAPQWLVFLSRILEALLFLFLAAALLKKILSTFQTFRNAKDENGDIVEELQEINEEREKTGKLQNRRRLSKREQIRREYRKTIRRHRKDRPAVYESPTEIEMIAGIFQSEAVQELHRNYEAARYGPETESAIMTPPPKK